MRESIQGGSALPIANGAATARRTNDRSVLHALLQSEQPSGVGLLAQVLPQLRAQHRGLAHHVDQAVLRLLQLASPRLRVVQHEVELLRSREPLERRIPAQPMQLAQPVHDPTGLDLPQTDRWAFLTGPRGTFRGLPHHARSLRHQPVPDLGAGRDHPYRRHRCTAVHREPPHSFTGRPRSGDHVSAGQRIPSVGRSCRCRGIHVPGHTACLAHLADADRDAYLAGLTPGARIDHRGTTFTESLLIALLNALRDPASRLPPLSRVRVSDLRGRGRVRGGDLREG